ncbi:hypothetical protein GIB67_009043 [Kingdonia uniflora]|uniref:Phospholipase D n=1 Tax=Kingdonia uniflora TaxID=39325 RepID=A0A7J7N5K2_9MAGN|nr:hypothetical protein GIB67_009043 [Kingdonia uniflora]
MDEITDRAEESVKKEHDVPEKLMFLHGDLDLWILEARSLPNMDLVSERMRRFFTIFGSCRSPFQRKTKHKGGHKIITSDPYVSVCLAGATVARTRVITNTENPSWDEHFSVPVAHPVSKVEFQVKDNDVLGAQLIGVVGIPVEKILLGSTINGWFPVVGPYGNPLKPYPELHVSIKFRPVEDNSLYKDGVGAGPDYLGVPKTYFPLHKGGNVTLYQDAHVPDKMLPEIQLDGGKIFEQGKCWEDICHAILEAHHLIYIIGWSIYPTVKLVREPTKPLPSGGELSLGELLKFKSQEGVRVEGVMQTHDEETRKFFKHSSVHCVMSPRYASNKLSIFKQQVVGTLFTHHQKCILLDTQASGNNRKITAFIGGLDLCDGRYDTPEHRLFGNLDSVFAGDFHNPTFPSRTRGPRQPWHDLHCRIEGPAAYDILTNFEQRWRKATKWRDFRIKKVTHWHDDALIKLDRISWILTPARDNSRNVHVSAEEDPENWHVFRSIDSGSVKGFPKVMKEAEEQVRVDTGVVMFKLFQFAYLESHMRKKFKDREEHTCCICAHNLVPMELALKIASKINAKERFSVYIVIPMWPEGSPSSAAVQEILFWQGQTMEMMYKIIAQALEKAGLSNESYPQDYLNFYCLGKREAGPVEGSPRSNQSSHALGLAQKFRRFMIYVHAKGMIVDDEYILMGSANINQRSLDGSRDTEIAMGAYQPNYTWARKKSHPHGQVYGYRMSLWAEHLGKIEDSFNEPHSIECVNRVNELAEGNWQLFVSDENKEMKGHLMKYPVKVDRSGKVEPLPGYDSFPDVGGKILGAPTNLPDALTT